MDGKIVGVIPLIAILCLTVFLTAGDKPVEAAWQCNVTQTASVSVGDVIGISVPNAVSNSWNSTNSTILDLLDSGSINNITSTSNGKIDVYIECPTGSDIPNSNASYTDTLTDFSFTNSTGTYPITTGHTKVFSNWKIPQGGGSDLTRNLGLSVNIPAFTAEGIYNTTVTYDAVKSDIFPM